MTRPTQIYLGIDFSGDQANWQPRAERSNVWIAELEEAEEALLVASLRRVQELPGDGRPFRRLANSLSARRFAAAAIDAPFSVPWWLFGRAIPDHAALLSGIGLLQHGTQRDFPKGNEFVAWIAQGIPFAFGKPLRATECYWRGRGVNVRSTVWTGKRPGAPFASACLKLLATAAGPVWPWDQRRAGPMVEAFPAAQLRHWGLPYEAYNDEVGGQSTRLATITFLEERFRLKVPVAIRPTLLENADALDAVLSAFAARGVAQDSLAQELPPRDLWRLEGWIAVHR